MPRPLILILALLAGSVPAQSAPPATYCPVIVYQDYRLGLTYKAVLRLPADCQGTARVRKSSTMNLRRNGAPYQPIKPLKGAWNVTRSGSDVPPNELWTLLTWRWEWYDGARWRGAL